MKKVNMLVDCTVVQISGTEFEDGGKAAKISLEDFHSFNVPENSPLLAKINIGTTFDLTYAVDKTKEGNTPSGGTTITYHNLGGVKVIASTIKQGTLDEELAALPDVTDPKTIVYKKVGATSETPAPSNQPPKV